MVTDERLIAQMRKEAAAMVRRYPRTRRGLADFDDLVQDVLIAWMQGFDPARGSAKWYLSLCVRSVCLDEKRDFRLQLDGGEITEVGVERDHRHEWSILIAVLPYLRTSELRAIDVQMQTGGWTDAAESCGVSKQALHKGIVGVQEICRAYAERGAGAVIGVRTCNMEPAAIALRARILARLEEDELTVA